MTPDPAAPGTRARRGPRLRWLVIGVLVVWLVGAGLLLLLGALDLRAGREAAAEARDAADVRALTTAGPAVELEEAEDRFASARSRFRSPVLAPLRVAPVVGRHLRSVTALSGAAAQLSGTAAGALREASAAFERPPSEPAARLRMLAEVEGIVVRARAALDGVRLGPRRALFGPVHEARQELAEQYDEARDLLARAELGLRGVSSLLTGPRTHLLVAANNAEMRAGSGMWLSGGRLRLGDGRMEVEQLDRIYELAEVPTATPIADPDLERNWGWMQPGLEWRSLMASPRLPASATQAMAMWEASGKEPVDGVVVVDVAAISRILRATGPIELEGRRYTADNVESQLLHEQYRRFDRQGQRRDALADLAQAVFARVDEGAWSAPRMAEALADAVAGRHLLAWSRDPGEQRAWEAMRLAGTLEPDSLLVSVLNRGANKLDWFLRTDAELTQREIDGAVEVGLALRLRNRTPEGLNEYIAGPFPGVDVVAGTYRGVVAFNVPAAARDLEIEGVEPEIRGADGPTQVIAGRLDILRGDERVVTLRFRVPRGTTIELEPSARVPGIRWRIDGRERSDGERRTFVARGGVSRAG